MLVIEIFALKLDYSFVLVVGIFTLKLEHSFVLVAGIFTLNCEKLSRSFLQFTQKISTIVKFMQLCSIFLPTALLNFACDWLALDRDISFGRLTNPNV